MKKIDDKDMLEVNFNRYSLLSKEQQKKEAEDYFNELSEMSDEIEFENEMKRLALENRPRGETKRFIKLSK